MDNQEFLKNIKNEIIVHNDNLYRNLLSEDKNINDFIFNERLGFLTEIKDQMKILGGIISTIMPFSSLIFTINSNLLIPNIYIWGLSFLLFSISLFKIIYSYFFIYDENFSEKVVYPLLNYNPIDLISYEIANDKEENHSGWLEKLMSVYSQQNSFTLKINSQLSEMGLIRKLGKNIKQSIYFFFAGLFCLFLSIFLHTFLELIKNIC